MQGRRKLMEKSLLHDQQVSRCGRGVVRTWTLFFDERRARTNLGRNAGPFKGAFGKVADLCEGSKRDAYIEIANSVGQLAHEVAGGGLSSRSRRTN
jgi:hypothetical protein